MNVDTDFILFIQINSKCIIDLSVKHKTMKLMEDNIRENLDDLEYGDDFLHTPKAQPMKERIDNGYRHAVGYYLALRRNELKPRRTYVCAKSLQSCPTLRPYGL